jgi:amino-acid N-acetyltransferase
MAIEVAPIRADEREALFRLVEGAGLPLDGLDAHPATTLVARRDGRIVGSAALEIHAGGALLRSVAVDASLRGEGLGLRLTNAALDLAGRTGAPAVYLLTTTAEDFFARLGFARIARAEVPEAVRRSVEFVSACPSSAVAMRKLLTR